MGTAFQWATLLCTWNSVRQLHMTRCTQRLSRAGHSTSTFEKRRFPTFRPQLQKKSLRSCHSTADYQDGNIIQLLWEQKDRHLTKSHAIFNHFESSNIHFQETDTDLENVATCQFDERKRICGFPRAHSKDGRRSTTLQESRHRN